MIVINRVIISTPSSSSSSGVFIQLDGDRRRLSHGREKSMTWQSYPPVFGGLICGLNLNE